MHEPTLSLSPASFRDPDGFVFQLDDVWYRYVSLEYQESYEHLMQSGLYDRLVQEHLLLPHQEVTLMELNAWVKEPYKILKPSQLSFISYPHEWSFSQLKDAALKTLKIQEIALEYGMSLKDASVFNIQAYKGKSLLIDSLSFMKHPGNKPWLALGQFYRHFFWPLLAMANGDVNINKLFILYPDGLKLETIKPWFGLKSWFKLSTFIHVHLHDLMSPKSSSTAAPLKREVNIKAEALLMLIQQIKRTIEKLDIKQNTIWKDYYQNTNYQTSSFVEKESIVKQFISHHKGNAFIDFGANNGHFSLFAKDYSDTIFALDFDPMAIDALYRNLNDETRKKITPLIVDLTNPPPAIGWQNAERSNLLSRLPKNASGLVLALTHHLHIANNINFEQQASFFNRFCSNLCIEFVQEDDTQAIKLLNNRYDHPQDYSQSAFELAFKKFYEIVQKFPINHTSRVIYILKQKS